MTRQGIIIQTKHIPPHIIIMGMPTDIMRFITAATPAQCWRTGREAREAVVME